MRLYEFEGKNLLQRHGFHVPAALSQTTVSEARFTSPAALKSQVLFGNRKRDGLIQLVQSETEFADALGKIQAGLAQHHLPLEQVTLLQETLTPFQTEYYLAFRYDTRSRRPVLLFTDAGGSGIEERGTKLQEYVLSSLEKPVWPPLPSDIPTEWLEKLFQVFLQEDLTLLEINPLVMVDGQSFILDVKAELDDTAAFRHPEWEELYPPRTLFQRQPTERELRAKQVNAMDHRGIAGAAYFEFAGSIGILASGGGASLLAMDALMATSLKPANYTEYSGNPPREKVKALSEVVLSQPKLDGLWVIGGHANFTDIYETLMGVMDAVETADLPAGFPIVMRRGGPRTEEAYAAVRERAAALNLHVELFDSSYPLTDTVHVLEKAVHAFRKAA